MTAGWLPAPVQDLFGDDAAADESYDVLTVDVPPTAWLTALETARTALGCTYFDWLSAVDEPGTGFRVCAHVVALAPVRRLLLRTTVPHASPVLPTAVGVYAGAAWHERETHEMFGVRFADHPSLTHLLLPDTFEGHPLRKDFVLVARAAKPWPGAKEPGESDHGAPKRRQILPPGVPDPNEWGPLKGQLPTAPPRPARTPRPATPSAATPTTPADRPIRRNRSASQGSASQPTPSTPTPDAPTPATPAAPARRTRSASEGSAGQQEPTTPSTPGTPTPARRTRSASQGSASQRDAGQPTTGDEPQAPQPSPAPQERPAPPHRPPAGPRRSRSASEGSASQRPQAEQTPRPSPPDASPAPDASLAPDAEPPASPPPSGPRRNRSASQGSASQRTQPPAAPRRPAPRSADAPWHHARPAFDDDTPPEPPAPEPSSPEADQSAPPADATPKSPPPPAEDNPPGGSR
ncbi:NADH-quinone oxidoreductase subunit C [Streptomyces roseirectus]|uniref:NADH-quinone oxidoreductase subunit C n=1 Tax=Streptomyces roseirectus TaxID=2768066 RepID=A0A7H0IDJ1_9ACTN|nr:NADH-quinone oxidoreductase subunit C [Streptomyces roseirectus]QNP70857.1 NADH-quinone oxidoreductase subunit C [Streptomyces roseirectus]